ncbi:hypothetical protein [Acinetobacter pollinis]|uniref:hypothetical protein n=1 Tax=Acinetobacter pollinis TaxID=2605270 RepID=UPI0018C22E2A|nr:hypothetical protein [Acinetobacter pollinis]MBF7694037.1 hypothetical protein [Acinetobacter pollinis]MBF7701666.1 hypothetical protein [Acinetobacter pollinis]
MPYRAIDMQTGLVQSVEWFIRNGKKKGLCGYCGTELTIKNSSNPLRPEFFWHSNQNTNCKTIGKNGIKYEGLKEGVIDKQAGAIIRKKIRENICQIYLACLKITNISIPFGDFKKCVEEASKKGVWDYKGLTFNYIPFIILTFSEKLSFYSIEDKGFIGYRLIFEPSVKSYDELWINPNLKINAWKIEKEKGELLDIVPIPTEIYSDEDLEPKYFSTIKI